jgi:hypothetical protein
MLPLAHIHTLVVEEFDAEEEAGFDGEDLVRHCNLGVLVYTLRVWCDAYMVYGVWCMSAWCMVYACMVYGVWCMSAWCMSAWCMVYECMVYGV